MAKIFHRKKFTAFIQRRRINALGLTVLTAASVIIALICAITNFEHTDIIVLSSIAMVVLCLLQYFKNQVKGNILQSFQHFKSDSPKISTRMVLDGNVTQPFALHIKNKNFFLKKKKKSPPTTIIF